MKPSPSVFKHTCIWLIEQCINRQPSPLLSVQTAASGDVRTRRIRVKNADKVPIVLKTPQQEKTRKATCLGNGILTDQMRGREGRVRESKMCTNHGSHSPPRFILCMTLDPIYQFT